MRDKEEFFAILTEIDGRKVAEYSRLTGDFDFSRFVVKINQVQPTLEGRSTLFVIRVPQYIAGFPAHLYNTPVRRTGLQDLLTREFADQLGRLAQYDEEGVARRRMSVAAPRQTILPRIAMVITEEYVEARVYVDLPARAGRVAGETAKHIFFDDLPRAVNGALIYCNLDEETVEDFVNVMEDADQIRQILPTRGWVGFVGDGAMLSRQSDAELPDYERIDSLIAPEALIADVEVPNQQTVRGLGIPAGITVIVGEAYSGRRELMQALAVGIYNHIPGDGREFVVTVPDAVYVATEPGRPVQRVDLRAFVDSRADGIDPSQFTTDNADPFVAQAASTVEALEVGAHVLLFDETDSAPSFLTQDTRLDGILDPGARVTTPLAARARKIADELGVSIIVGGSSLAAEFLPIADTVFRIEDFKIEDITEQARKLSVKPVAEPDTEVDLTALVEQSRSIVASSLDPSAGRHDTVIEAPNVHTLRFGRSKVDLSSVIQLADVHQTTTIGLILSYARTRYMLDEGRPIREVLDLVDRDLSTEGLECLSRDPRGDLTRPRRYEIAAALNRLDTLRVTRASE